MMGLVLVWVVEVLMPVGWPLCRNGMVVDRESGGLARNRQAWGGWVLLAG